MIIAITLLASTLVTTLVAWLLRRRLAASIRARLPRCVPVYRHERSPNHRQAGGHKAGDDYIA